jgi:hypothetical protein
MPRVERMTLASVAFRNNPSHVFARAGDKIGAFTQSALRFDLLRIAFFSSTSRIMTEF